MLKKEFEGSRNMNIGVIGTGDIGQVIIRKLRDAGYPVKMANSRGPESLEDLATKTGAIPRPSRHE